MSRSRAGLVKQDYSCRLGALQDGIRLEVFLGREPGSSCQARNMPKEIDVSKLNAAIVRAPRAPRDLRERVRHELRQLYEPVARKHGLVEIPRGKGEPLFVLRWGRPNTENTESIRVFEVAAWKDLKWTWTAFLSPWKWSSGHGYTPEQLDIP